MRKQRSRWREDGVSVVSGDDFRTRVVDDASVAETATSAGPAQAAGADLAAEEERQLKRTIRKLSARALREQVLLMFDLIRGSQDQLNELSRQVHELELANGHLDEIATKAVQQACKEELLCRIAEDDRQFYRSELSRSEDDARHSARLADENEALAKTILYGMANISPSDITLGIVTSASRVGVSANAACASLERLYPDVVSRSMKDIIRLGKNDTAVAAATSPSNPGWLVVRGGP